jgi:ankyrin repeat protein
MYRTVQPLHTAAKKGRVASLQALISEGHDLDAFDNSRTPLMWGAMEGHSDAVRVLLDAGASIDARSVSDKQEHRHMEYGWSALMEALLHSRFETARLLLERGADVNFESQGGHTALTILTLNYSLRVRRYGAPVDDEPNNLLPLLKKTGLRIGLPEAVLLGDVERVTALLAAGAEVDATDKRGTTALMLATICGQHDIMRLLVSHGASVNAQDYSVGNTALMQAAWNRDDEAIQLLLTARADATIKNRLGRTGFEPPL